MQRKKAIKQNMTCAKYDQQSLKKLIIAALAVLFLDQFSKFAITEKIFTDTAIHRNYNALFGWPFSFYLILAFFILALLILLFCFEKIVWLRNDKLAAIAFGLMFGGIASNLIDRTLFGYIKDYLNLINLFSFNFADLAIFFGALMLSWKILRK
jgi:lipoprotein signal peptidase